VLVMTINDVINGIFLRLATGELAEITNPLQDGWQVDLPSGRTVSRSILQTEAESLIKMGPDAVPHLLPWVMHDNPGLRYVAVYSLEQITGEKPYLPYFDQTDLEENRPRAIKVWKTWYETRQQGTGGNA
jgi:hypothetical protein